jgi:hypothetical protein
VVKTALHRALKECVPDCISLCAWLITQASVPGDQPSEGGPHGPPSLGAADPELAGESSNDCTPEEVVMAAVVLVEEVVWWCSDGGGCCHALRLHPATLVPLFPPASIFRRPPSRRASAPPTTPARCRSCSRGKPSRTPSSARSPSGARAATCCTSSTGARWVGWARRGTQRRSAQEGRTLLKALNLLPSSVLCARVAAV